MSSLAPFPRFVQAYPDESCYSFLCRIFIFTALSSARFCKMLFGKILPLDGLLYKPLKSRDLPALSQDPAGLGKELFVHHSCIPYWYPFLREIDQKLSLSWYGGETLAAGQYKRLSRSFGYRKWKKEHLFYCSECVRQDRIRYGETYWHMIHQLPGVSVCPAHRVCLKESAASVRETRYNLLPAEYVLKQAGYDVAGAFTEMEYQVARISMHLLENGFSSQRILELSQGDMDGRQQRLPEEAEAILKSSFRSEMDYRGTPLYSILTLVCNQSGRIL